MAIPVQGDRWHRDLLVFAVLCTLWSALLIFRVVTRDPFSSQAYPFQDVFLGLKFYGRVAHITMADAAARLASVAAAGEVLLSQGVFATVADELPAQDSRTMQLRGREFPFFVRVLRRPGAIAPSS